MPDFLSSTSSLRGIDPKSKYLSGVIVLASTRALITHHLTPGTIVISRATGKITVAFDVVIDPATFPDGTLYIDHSPDILLPGLVDTNVRLGKPGQIESGDIWNGTRLAASGGVTTLVELPFDSTSLTPEAKTIKEAAEGNCWVDVGFYTEAISEAKSEPKDQARDVETNVSSGEIPVATDPAAKEDFFEERAALAALDLGMSIMWSEGAPRSITLDDIIQQYSTKPAKKVGLTSKKGRLARGFDGDVIIFDDTAEFNNDSAPALFRNNPSAYKGRILTGIVRETWLRGNRIFSTEDGFNEKAGPVGKLLF